MDPELRLLSLFLSHTLPLPLPSLVHSLLLFRFFHPSLPSLESYVALTSLELTVLLQFASSLQQSCCLSIKGTEITGM